MSNETRRIFFPLALIAGLFIAGGFCGVGLRMWIGGLRQQHAQLERCVLDSRHSHANEDPRSRLARLEVEVPACMKGAGYEKTLNNKSCSRGPWQGDVFCYLPKSSLGKLIFLIETSHGTKAIADDGKKKFSPGEG